MPDSVPDFLFPSNAAIVCFFSIFNKIGSIFALYPLGRFYLNRVYFYLIDFMGVFYFVLLSGSLLPHNKIDYERGYV